MNKSILMGRLTKDVVLKYAPNNNTPVVAFMLAVDRRFKKQGEENQTDFIPIIAWGKMAEFCNRYLHKGSRIVVVGRIQVRTWDDNNGKKHYATEVVAEEIYFADSKKETGTSPNFYSAAEDDELPF